MAHPTFKQMMNEVVGLRQLLRVRHLRPRLPAQRHRLRRRQAEAGRQGDGAFDFCGISEGIGCDVCAQVCPRLGIREFDLRDAVLPDGARRLRGRLRPLPPHRRRALQGPGDPRPLPGRRRRDGDSLPRAPRGPLRRRRRLGRRRDDARGAEAARSSPRSPTRSRAPAPGTPTARTTSPSPTPSAWVSAKVCFVGVPCQITPTRKIQLADPSYLDNGRKKEKHIERQTKFLKGFGEQRRLHRRAPLHRGLHLRGPHGRRRSRTRWASRSPT